MQIIALTFAISGFHREVDENCALLGYYAASSGAFLPTLRYNLLVPISGVRNFLEQMGPIGWPVTSARNYNSLLRYNPENAVLSTLYMNGAEFNP